MSAVTDMPIRPSKIMTEIWTGVDSSTGQAITFNEPIKAIEFHVYPTGETDYADTFVLVGTSSNHADGVTIAKNPYTLDINVRTPGVTVCTIKASSGTVAIHAVAVR